MAAQHGKNTFISMGGTSIGVFCDKSDFSQDVDLDETSAYGDTNKTYIAGLIDTTFSLGGKYDTVATGPRAKFEAAIDGGVAVAFVRQIEGVGTGKPSQAFSGFVESYVETAPVGGKITWSADVQVSGPVTRSTQA